MKYNFKSQKESLDVIVETKREDGCYHSTYISIPSMGIENVWTSGIEYIKDTPCIVIPATTEHMPIAIAVPDDIAANIMAEQRDACICNDKIIQVVIYGNDLHIVTEKFCKAIAVPMFRHTAWYTISDRMLKYLEAQAKDGKIYDMGGIEDDPEHVNRLTIDDTDKRAKYQYIQDYDNTAWDALGAAFGFDKQQGDCVCIVELRLIDNIMDDDKENEQ